MLVSLARTPYLQGAAALKLVYVSDRMIIQKKNYLQRGRGKKWGVREGFTEVGQGAGGEFQNKLHN